MHSDITGVNLHCEQFAIQFKLKSVSSSILNSAIYEFIGN